MNVAKSVLGALLALPFAELVVFILVASEIGFTRALALVVGSSLIGVMVLRRAGGKHVERVRGALGSGNFTSLHADGRGAVTLLAGFLLLVPGFITSAIGIVLLLAPLSLLGWALGIRPDARAPRADGVVDLEPEQWSHVPDPALTDKSGKPNDDAQRR